MAELNPAYFDDNRGGQRMLSVGHPLPRMVLNVDLDSVHLDYGPSATEHHHPKTANWI